MFDFDHEVELHPLDLRTLSPGMMHPCDNVMIPDFLKTICHIFWKINAFNRYQSQHINE
jgi:hypothetical protein